MDKMPKRASDYEKEKCYTGKTWAKQHKDPDCRYLKSRDVIETNRREAYKKGAKTVCVHCWFDYTNNTGKSRDNIMVDCHLSVAEINEIAESLATTINDGHDGSVVVNLFEKFRAILNNIDERGK